MQNAESCAHQSELTPDRASSASPTAPRLVRGPASLLRWRASGPGEHRPRPSLLAVSSLCLLSLLASGCPSEKSAPEGGLGEACRADGTCEGTLVCRDEVCRAPEADPCAGQLCSGHGRCEAPTGEAACVCDAGWAGAECAECDLAGGYLEDPPGSGQCRLDPCPGRGCSDGERRCADADSTETCAAGCWGQPADCPTGEVCRGDGCVALVCTPGAARCAEDGTPERCADDGSAYERLDPCGEKAVCEEGACVGLCTLNARKPSAAGCAFVALELPQADTVPAGQLRLLLTNPGALEAVIEVRDGAGQPLALGADRVPAGSSLVIELPSQPLAGSGLSESAFLISSDVPLTAAQLNPASAASGTTDAARLLPVERLGQEYVVLGWPSFYVSSTGGEWDLYASVHVVSLSLAPIQVTVTSPVRLRAGDGVQAVAVNTPTVFALQPGQVLSLATPKQDGLDLSGMHLQAGAPVAVFFAHRGAMVPLGTMLGDHLEEQLLPTSAWGDRYLAPLVPPRGSEPTIWRVMAAEDGTTIVTDPALPVSGRSLDRGEVLEFAADGAFELNASKPVLLAQLSVGSLYEGLSLPCADGNTGTGDPSMVLPPATRHYGREWQVEVPAGFDSQWLTVLRLDGATSVLLDGQAVVEGDWTGVGGAGGGSLRLAVDAGLHTIVGSGEVGVLLHGWSCQAEYGLAAGYTLAPR